MLRTPNVSGRLPLYCLLGNGCIVTKQPFCGRIYSIIVKLQIYTAVQKHYPYSVLSHYWNGRVVGILGAFSDFTEFFQIEPWPCKSSCMYILVLRAHTFALSIPVDVCIYSKAKSSQITACLWLYILSNKWCYVHWQKATFIVRLNSCPKIEHTIFFQVLLESEPDILKSHIWWDEWKCSVAYIQKRDMLLKDI